MQEQTPEVRWDRRRRRMVPILKPDPVLVAAKRDAERTAVLNMYGNLCACCKEQNPLFLTIDHINNDGYRDRKFTSYAGLLKRPKRRDLQVLCYNCNMGKARNGGACPHLA